MRARPSNIVIKIFMIIVVLFACYILGGFILKAFKATRQNSEESSNVNLDCRSLDNSLICVFNSNELK